MSPSGAPHTAPTWWLLGPEADRLAAELPSPWPTRIRPWTRFDQPSADNALQTSLAPAALRMALLATDGRALPADEAQWRAWLCAHGLPHHVLHPVGGCHRQPLRRLLGIDEAPAPKPQTTARWHCESCSDPDGEHRLFRRLLAGRPA